MANETKFENDVFSRVLKYKLATNFYYTMIDEVKGTSLYNENLEELIKQVEEEMDKQQEGKVFQDFHKLTGSTKHVQESLKLHEYFFNKICRMPVQELEEYMIDFCTKPKIKKITKQEITEVVNKHFKKVSDEGVGFLNTNISACIDELNSKN
jgi:hypothetical protein